jgi:3-oxoacid CoA-transferase subunit B
MEVSENGDIMENSRKNGKGMGGAMDLVASAENIVAMMHVNRHNPRFLNSVAYH